MSAFPRLLASWRAQAGVSQVVLSAWAGIDRSYLSHLEKGERNPSRRTVASLSAALELDQVAAAEFFLAAGFAPPGGAEEALWPRA
jgi:transcriptional regulator with XRE-family HTH domain